MFLSLGIGHHGVRAPRRGAIDCTPSRQVCNRVVCIPALPFCSHNPQNGLKNPVNPGSDSGNAVMYDKKMPPPGFPNIAWPHPVGAIPPWSLSVVEGWLPTCSKNGGCPVLKTRNIPASPARRRGETFFAPVPRGRPFLFQYNVACLSKTPHHHVFSLNQMLVYINQIIVYISAYVIKDIWK